MTAHRIKFAAQLAAWIAVAVLLGQAVVALGAE
jgi:hypothetical protein